MKEILIISQWPTPWGTDRKIGVPERYGLIKRLSKEGFCVRVISIGGDGNDDKKEDCYHQYYFKVLLFQAQQRWQLKGNNSFEFFLRKLLSLWDIFAFTSCSFVKSVKVYRRESTKPCMVVSYGEFGALSVCLLGYFWKVPKIVRLYGSRLYQEFSKIDKQWKRFVYCTWVNYVSLWLPSDMIIATDDDCKIDLAVRFMKLRSPLILSPNGVNQDEFADVDVQLIKSVKNRYDLNEFDILIGSVGRWVTQKRNELLLEALPKIVSCVNVKVGCFFVGGGPNEVNYVNTIKKHQLDKIVRLVGPVTRDQIAPFFHSADIFFSAFAFWNKSYTFLEAMVAGRAVVTTTELRENQFIIRDKTVAMIEETADHDEMVNRVAKKVIELIENPNLRRQLGQNARQYTAKYLWSVNEQNEDEFSKLMSLLEREERVK